MYRTPVRSSGVHDVFGPTSSEKNSPTALALSAASSFMSGSPNHSPLPSSYAEGKYRHNHAAAIPRRFCFALGGFCAFVIVLIIYSSPSGSGIASETESTEARTRVVEDGPTAPFKPVLAGQMVLSSSGTKDVAVRHNTSHDFAVMSAPYRGVSGSKAEHDEAKQTVKQKLAVRMKARAASRRAQQLAELIPPPVRGPKLARRYRYGSDFKGKPGEPSLNIGDDSNVLRDEVPNIQAFIDAARRKYNSEESFWRSFTWEAPDVHASIRAWEARLGSEDQRIRDIVAVMRRDSTRAQSIGLLAHKGASNPLETSSWKRHNAEKAQVLNRFSRALSNKFNLQGPTTATPPTLRSINALPSGSPAKWAELLSEEKALGEGHLPQCGASAKAWFDDYARHHRRIMKDAVRGEGFGRSKFITYICQSGINCGGLGDRLLGMTSAFLYALVTGRAFHAEWQSPIPIEAVFDSPHIDWSFSTFGDWTAPLFRDRDLIDAARELDIIHYSASEMDDAFGSRPWDADLPSELTRNYEQRDLAFASPWIQFYNNRGFVYRSFAYEPIKDRLHELGLQPHSAFSCIMSYLFEPKPSARDFILRYTSIFSLPSVFSIGIQIRTGDTSMKDPEYDQVNTVELHKSFFQCAQELAEEYATPDQRVLYYLVTDSQHLREDATAQYGDQIVISGLGIEHVHQRAGHADGVQNAVIEEWILAKTDYRVITQNSGFGKIASFAAAKPSSTVTIFPRNNRDTVGLMTASSLAPLDCRKDSAFTSFEQLASEWSLA